ncbi:hypothetical protein PWG11_17890 (plasmid) [Proteus mirabilis]|uniref:hypothetical protein n=1 Tax=Proteus mirabilis TaxID=584 RepID=UPI0038F76CF8
MIKLQKADTRDFILKVISLDETYCSTTHVSGSTRSCCPFGLTNAHASPSFAIMV